MKLGTVRVYGGAPRFVGKVNGSDHVIDIVEAGRDFGLIDGTFPDSLHSLLKFWTYGEQFIRELEEVVRRRGDLESAPWSTHEDHVSFMPPIPRPGKLVCINANRGKRGLEPLDPGIQDEWPHPLFFLKAPSSLTGNRATVDAWRAMRPVEIEGEVCLFIKRRARNIAAEDIWSVVAGCTLMNDIAAGRFSLQDGAVLQIARGDDSPPEPMVSRQMARAKGADGFCPMGPWVVPIDDLGIPFEDIEVITRRGEDVVQRGVMSQQKFTPGQCLEWVTRWMTLEPGDILSLGAFDQMPDFPFRDVDLSENGGGTAVVAVAEPAQIDPLETQFVVRDPSDVDDAALLAAP